MHYSEKLLLSMVSSHDWTPMGEHVIELGIANAVESGEVSNGLRIISFSFDESGRWGKLTFGFDFNYEIDCRLYCDDIDNLAKLVTSIAIKAVKLNTQYVTTQVMEELEVVCVEQLQK